MKRIVFVDDEPNVLSGLRRMLRPMRDQWEMYFCPSAQEGLAQIKATDCDVVVSDMSMPGMDGAQLLKAVRETDARIARIVLSGQTEQAATLKSIGVAHRYLSKPCDTEQLRITIEQTCRLRDKLHDERLIMLVNSLGSLPALPENYQHLRAELSKPEPDLSSISNIVSQDIGMSAKILQIINSAFFGLTRTFTQVDQAVRMLGLDTIHSLALSTSAFECFDSGDVVRLTAGFPEHSIRVATAASTLARHQGAEKEAVDQAFQAGLLHDIGKLVLAHKLPSEFESSQTMALERQMASQSAEVETIGHSHCQIGAYLLGLWGLPDSIVEAVADHHSAIDPSTNADQMSLPEILQIADWLVHEIEPAPVQAAPQLRDWLAQDTNHKQLAAPRAMIHEALSQDSNSS